MKDGLLLGMTICGESNTSIDGYNIKKNTDIENYKVEPSNRITPVYVQINKIKTKRMSPYLESELWEKDEIVSIIYETDK